MKQLGVNFAIHPGWDASPLQVTPLPSPALFQVSLTVHWYPFILLGQVVQRVYNAIQQINRYPVDKFQQNTLSTG